MADLKAIHQNRRGPLTRQSDGAGAGIRTPDLLITSELLYRLSYPGKGTGSLATGAAATVYLAAMAANDPLDVVTRFCAAWATGDLDEIMAFFTDDATYHNIPVDPVEGKDAIRTTIAGFTTGVQKLEFRVDNIAASGNVVLTERVDVFTMPDKEVSLPVMGTFEVRDGRIAAWRDYFDLNQFMSQIAG